MENECNGGICIVAAASAEKRHVFDDGESAACIKCLKSSHAELVSALPASFSSLLVMSRWLFELLDRS